MAHGFGGTQDSGLAPFATALAAGGLDVLTFDYRGFGASGGYADMDLKAFGIPSEQEYLAAYARRTGRAGIEHWNFYLAFSLFRLAAIVQHHG